VVSPSQMIHSTWDINEDIHSVCSA